MASTFNSSEAQQFFVLQQNVQSESDNMGLTNIVRSHAEE